MNVAVRPESASRASGRTLVRSGSASQQENPRSVASDDRFGFNFISLCTGGAGLDLGLELAIPAARPVLLVEREAFAVAHLVEAMQQGFLADAPVWSDVQTLNGRGWRGLVDGLIGGIPCQPHSTAGNKQGSLDERDLWSDARRIIAQARPWFVLIENVAGMLTAGAVGPEAQSKGHVEIAGAQRVRGDLQKLGYAVEGGLFTASEVSAPHERKRVFILALRREWPAGVWHELANGGCNGNGTWSRDNCEVSQVSTGNGQPENRAHVSDGCGNELADSDTQGSQIAGRSAGTGGDRQSFNRSQPVGNAQDADGRSKQQAQRARGRRAGPPRTSADALGDAHGPRRSQAGTGPSKSARSQPETRGGSIPDAACVQRQSVERSEPDGDDAGIRSYWDIPIFPPGPSERDVWEAIAATHPHLEPAVCRMADGMAAGMDINRLADACLAHRVDRLRMLGNGVVSLEAAHAIRSLLVAHHAAGTLETDRFVWMMREAA